MIITVAPATNDAPQAGFAGVRKTDPALARALGCSALFATVMSCTVTAVTPTDGVEVQLREYQTGGTGNRLWPASIVLIRYLFGAGGIPAEELPRARIVELGAGTGLVSIALAKAGV